MEIAILVFLGAVALVALSQMAVVVPEQNVYLLERLGRFDRALHPGLHFVIPFVERVAYRHSLKELPVDIDEQICIGCTLCIQACPVDAIVGATKQMHTVIEAECTGCDLCLPPCPVDCIEMIVPKQDYHQWRWPKPGEADKRQGLR